MLEFSYSFIDEMTTWRRTLHAHPGTAYEEYFARDFIITKLRDWNIPFVEGLAKTGIVAWIDGYPDQNERSIALRADMDALDMIEENTFDHRSIVPNKKHGCGHDGHMATLLGTIFYLSQNKHFFGRVFFIFQPAEEGQHGAETMIHDGLFSRFKIDEIFGYHNWPFIPLGQAELRTGPFLAAVDRFDVVLKGQGGHGAYPHSFVDPIPATCAYIQALNTIISRNVFADTQAVLSVTNMSCESGSFNTIHDQSTISGTLRTFCAGTRSLIVQRMQEIGQGIEISFKVKIDLKIDAMTECVVNHPEQTKFAFGILKQQLGEDNVNPNAVLCMGGEDFGAFLKHKPGAFVFLGQGEPACPDAPWSKGLHHVAYDYNDRLLPLSVRYFTDIVRHRLSSP